jgi:hypothetical protein
MHEALSVLLTSILISISYCNGLVSSSIPPTVLN